MSAANYSALLAKGCLCGTERPQDCSLHGPGDNRGIRAFFRAGMPKAFPMAATCAICGMDGLMYPDVELDDGATNSDGPTPHRPTLICPACSTPAVEIRLRGEVEASGLHDLNAASVFGAVAA